MKMKTQLRHLIILVTLVITQMVCVNEIWAIDWTGTKTGYEHTSSSTETIRLTGDVNLTGIIKVTDGHLILNLNGHVLKRNGNGRAIEVTGGKLTIDDGSPTTSHKGTLTNWTVNGVTAKYWVYDNKGNTVINGGIITGGYVAGDGGCINQTGGTVVLSKGTIAGNRVANTGTFSGGGVYVEGGTYIQGGGGYILYNVAASGGGIIAYDGKNANGTTRECIIQMNQGTISNNWATGYPGTGFGNGGAIYVNTGALLKIQGCTMENNYAYRWGGAINLNNGGSVEMFQYDIQNKDVVIKSNKAGMNGGAISIENTTCSLSLAPPTGATEIYTFTIQNNEAEGNGETGEGGGIYAPLGTLILEDVVFTGNKAKNGGGIYFNETATLKDCTFTNNSATVSGGGIYKEGALTLTGTTLINDNKKGTALNNIFIPTDATQKYVNIGTLSCSSSIGITKTHDFSTDSNGEDYTQIAKGTAANCATAFNNHFFFDDANNYGVYNLNTSPYSNAYLYFIETWKTNAANTANDVTLSGTTATVKTAAGLAWVAKQVNAGTNYTVNLANDIDLDGHYWEPIGERYTACSSTTSHPFSGTFDGQGHTITNLESTLPIENMGLFGYVTGTVKNVLVLSGTLNGSSTNKGGLVGYLTGSVFNCAAAVTLTNGTTGGLVGEVGTGGSLKNSYAIVASGNGLAGKNSGTVENCYARGASTLVGSGTGSTNNCYASGGTQSGTNGTFTDTETPYLYKHYDNQVTAGNTNSYVPSGNNKQLVTTLNNWVNNNSGQGYATWMRTCASPVNGDYPLFNFPNHECVGYKTNSNAIEYGSFNTKFNQYVNANTGTIYLYNTPAVLDATTDAQANVNVSNANKNTKLYIGEHVALKPSNGTGDIVATVGITLDNSAGANGAHPTQGGTDAMDWHMFSTPLEAAPLGINYENNEQEYPFVWGGHPSNDNGAMPYWHFYDDATNHGYFPSHQYNTSYNGSVSNNATAGGNYYNDWDFYTYYEPEYHWINFKRNGQSHWHEDYPDVRINYKSNGTGDDWTNETHLIKGRGYLLSTVEPTYLQCSGTLTKGNVSVNLTARAWVRTGYNLLGNPYQSYLDFNEFAAANSGEGKIWAAKSSASYYIIDEDNGGYLKYAYNASSSEYIAQSYLHPHQGFMVIAENAATATFTEAMRNTTTTENVTFRDGEGTRPAYPLVNLIATEENGNRDVCTVELGRPDEGGAPVMRNLRICKGLIYCRYDDADWAIAFTRPGLSEVPIRFETTDDAEFTLTWDMENADFGYLHLIDNMTGADIDCLTETEYRFSAKTTDYESRFRLVFEYTGIDEGETPEPVEGSASFAFQMGDNLVVNGEGTLQIVDLTGRVLATRELHGTQSTVPMPNANAGIYLLRLSNANGTRTQKIVLR